MVEGLTTVRIVKNRRIKMTYVLGLTGGIASGKSTVSQIFKQLDVPIIDADQIAREVVLPGTKVLELIKDAFGQNIIDQNGQLDRKTLGSIIFQDQKKREQLNGILHPLILNRISYLTDELKRDGHPLIVLDIPLLYEINFEKELDSVMVVYVSEETQLERLMNRDEIEEKEARRKIETQMSLDHKAIKADYVINNNGSLEETTEQVKQWYGQHAYQ